MLEEIANDDVSGLILDVDGAIDGETSPQPAGWLAQLRRLRNRVAHTDSLARTGLATAARQQRERGARDSPQSNTHDRSLHHHPLATPAWLGPRPLWIGSAEVLGGETRTEHYSPSLT
jgi:hypothetical protein